MCPRGRPRGQGRPRGLHLWLNKQVYSHIGATWGSIMDTQSLQYYYISQIIKSTVEIASYLF